MDSPGTLTWPTPKKEISKQKMSYTYPKKQFFKRKKFPRSFERIDHLPHPKNGISSQNFFKTYPKQTPTFYNKKCFTPVWNNRFFTQIENLYYSLEKIIKEKISYNYQKKHFSGEKISYAGLTK